MDQERAARLLALLGLPGIGPKKVWDAYTRTGSVEALYVEARKGWPEARRRLDAALPTCRAAVEEALASGLAVLTLQDKGYPPVLRDDRLPPPPVLFVRGTLPRQLLGAHVSEVASVGVVGTRKATREGLEEARALGFALSVCGAVVVSGLALGVDGAAHRGAVAALRSASAAAPTVAVLGGAHDRLHPRAHARLAEEVLETGGAVFSEHPPGTNPQPSYFLRRNRLIAALSHVLVVVEAGVRSGALDTVEHAGRIGRTVLTVPARPSDRRRAGNLALLRGRASVLVDLSDLATHLSSVGQVAEALEALAGEDRLRAAPPGREPGAGGASRAKAAGPVSPAARASGPHAGAPERPHGAATGQAIGYRCRRVLVVLAAEGDASFDGLLARLTRSGTRPRPTPAELAGCLVRLEMAGCVVRGEDGRYRARAAGRHADRGRLQRAREPGGLAG